MWGCPKVLYLVLCNFYYNDLHSGIRYCKVHHFADYRLSDLLNPCQNNNTSKS